MLIRLEADTENWALVPLAFTRLGRKCLNQINALAYSAIAKMCVKKYYFHIGHRSLCQILLQSPIRLWHSNHRDMYLSIRATLSCPSKLGKMFPPYESNKSNSFTDDKILFNPVVEIIESLFSVWFKFSLRTHTEHSKGKSLGIQAWTSFIPRPWRETGRYRIDESWLKK